MTPSSPSFMIDRVWLTSAAARKPRLWLLAGTSAFACIVIYFGTSVFSSSSISLASKPPFTQNIILEPGTIYRDARPIATAQRFLELAQSEVAAKGLPTCKDRLGLSLVQAYNTSHLDYCTSSSTTSGSRVECFPVHGSPFSSWWPYPNAFCVSSGLQTRPQDSEQFQGRCEVTAAGKVLLEDMGGEKFLGSHLTTVPEQVTVNKDGMVNHTVLLIGRQDQWNPFHVAEDLVTSILALLVAGHSKPELVSAPIQLVFTDKFGVEQNHFSTLWDRMGAWPPRRLSLDPFEPGTTLTNAIHSIGAGSSLLSSIGVGNEYRCASTLVWASSHYYRHLFGLHPPNQKPSTPEPINIIWLSRAKMNAHEEKIHQLTDWQLSRVLLNEPELIARLRMGLKGLCAHRGRACDFTDAEEDPQSWFLPGPDGRRRPIRFISIDPYVHALESQIGFVGHSNIIMGLHGGALGLSMFLPPGRGTIFELHRSSTAGNYHFHNMAAQMGHRYETIRVSPKVRVDEVWSQLERIVVDMLTQG